MKMTDPTIRAHLDGAHGLRISSSSGARVQGAHFAPCVLDLLGRARHQAHAAMESVI
jgi:hypothetical protein